MSGSPEGTVEGLRRGRPWPGRLHALFESSAERHPEAPCVTRGEQVSTYGWVEQEANRLAHALLRLRAARGKEPVVALACAPSVELVVAILAVLKSGAAYAPLDVGAPAAHLRRLIEATQPCLVLHEREDLGPGGEVPRLRLGQALAAARAEPPTRPSLPARPEQLAYVISTSGSTGEPRPVMVSHAGVSGWLQSHAQESPVAPGERCLWMAPPFFDASVVELFLPLALGAHLIIAPAVQEVGVTGLARVLAHWQPRKLGLSPALLRELLALDDLPYLPGEVFSGGEALPPHVAKRFFDRGGQVLNNSYGPTETTISVCRHVMRGPTSSDRVPIGRPFGSARLYVLDPDLRPCAPGTDGLLYVGGPTVARGYLGQPDWTAARFLPDPFSDVPGARLFATGDRVRWSTDGELWILGRADRQVKVRGNRVELEDVEVALARCLPAGAEVAVGLAAPEGGEQELVAYVGRWDVADGPELRRRVSELVPGYMVPSGWVFLSELPRTPAGKVDREKLPAPTRGASSTSQPPQGPLEERVAGIWAEVLKGGPVGRSSNFFELGGHSLAAMRVAARLTAQLGVVLGPRALFEAPTLQSFCAALAAAPQRTPPRPVTRRGLRDAPVSFGQERLFLAAQMDPESLAARIPFAVELPGDTDLRALSDAFEELQRRHEVLRTTFFLDDDTPMQRVHAGPLSRLEEVPVTAGGWRQGALELFRAPLDLERGPLLRAQVLTDAHTGTRHLAVVMHHIVSDAWSMAILRRELNALYAWQRGRLPALPPLEVQYADYAVWQRGWVEAVAPAQLEYWQRTLAGAPPVLALPRAEPVSAREERAGIVRLQLEADLTERLSSLGRAQNASLFLVLAAGLLMELRRLSGQQDLVLGTDVAGRVRPETEAMMGYFVNHLPLRVQVAEGLAFPEVLAKVRDAALGAFDHADVPFEHILRRHRQRRDARFDPLFQVALTLQNVPRDPGGTPLGPPLTLDVPTVELDLWVAAEPGPSGVELELRYRADRFSPPEMAGLLESLRAVLVAAAGRAARSGPPDGTCAP